MTSRIPQTFLTSHLEKLCVSQECWPLLCPSSSSNSLTTASTTGCQPTCRTSLATPRLKLQTSHLSDLLEGLLDHSLWAFYRMFLSSDRRFTHLDVWSEPYACHWLRPLMTTLTQAGLPSYWPHLAFLKEELPSSLRSFCAILAKTMSKSIRKRPSRQFQESVMESLDLVRF